MKVMNRFHCARAALILGMVMLLAGRAAAADDSERAKQFVVMGYQGIVNELASGRGPYLNTLLDLLHIPSDQAPAALDQIRGFAKTYPNMMDFTEHVLERYGSIRPGESPIPAPASAPLLSTLPPDTKIYSGESLENALMHLVKGMKVTVYLKSGAQVSGMVSDYDARRLWMRTPTARSFKLDEIQGLEAPLQ